MERLHLFPDSTRIHDGCLTVADCNLEELAETFGTPLYLYDRATMDRAVEAYRQALQSSYPAASGITYAGKAYLCTAIAEWSFLNGLWLDCTGKAEIKIAVNAGVPASSLIVHGVNKSRADLEAAIRYAGVVVVDNLSELNRLQQLSEVGKLPDLWLRFQPGVAPKTHRHIQTGHAGSKFGMNKDQIIQAIRTCQNYGLPLSGFHFHLGSQMGDPSPVIAAISKVLELVGTAGFTSSWTLCPGGGWGVAYHEDDPQVPDIAGYVRSLADAVMDGCRVNGLSLPRLQLEPGRSLIARAGVALYRVGVIKKVSDRTWCLLDGGLADNPRPALYGARYTALPVRGPERPGEDMFWFAGPHCESGDILIEALPFPRIQEGDLVAVPVSGAYQLSMASNYNGSLRPAVLWLEQGRAFEIQVREMNADTLARDRRLVKP